MAHDGITCWKSRSDAPSTAMSSIFVKPCCTFHRVS